MAEAQPVDEALIARLFPVDTTDDDPALETIEKHQHRLGPQIPEGQLSAPCLELRFSKSPRTKHGYILGTHRTCDIVLPLLDDVSPRHCTLTFEHVSCGNTSTVSTVSYRLVLRDYSTYGTIVTFSNSTVRVKNTRCILDWQNQIKDDIIIQFPSALRFRIVVATQVLGSPNYASRVNRFLQETASAEEIITSERFQTYQDTLRITSGETQTNRSLSFVKVRKPDQRSYSQCSVTMILDASSGASYAGKEIIAHTSEVKTKERAKKLKAVMGVWRDLRDQRIVRFIDWVEPLTLNGTHMLLTEHCAHGNILEAADKRPLTRIEIVQAISQIAQGLIYLHGRDMPHGNLKPSNILVRNRTPLNVALADMGHSCNDDSEWRDNPHYLSPELVEDTVIDLIPENAYAFPSDIWALGATAVHLVLGALPAMKDPHEYPRRVLHPYLHSPGTEDALETLLRPMLGLNPFARPSATDCWTDAEETLHIMTTTGKTPARTQ